MQHGKSYSLQEKTRRICSGHMLMVNRSRKHDEWLGFCFYSCQSFIHSNILDIYITPTGLMKWRWKHTNPHNSNNPNILYSLSFPFCTLWSMWKTQEQAPFLRWNASRCEQIHQCVSPTEILRWWMDLMDWFKPQLPLLTDWITEWMLEQITSAGGECIYTVHFLHSWVHPSLMADC